MEGGATATPSSSSTSVVLATAPFVYLAAQKDRQYVELLSATFQDALQLSPPWGIGGRLATQLVPETNLLARLVYFYLSYCEGHRTLGQMYCDMLPVHIETTTFSSKGTVARQPRQLGDGRRIMLVLAQALLPYINDRWQHGFPPMEAFASTEQLRRRHASAGDVDQNTHDINGNAHRRRRNGRQRTNLMFALGHAIVAAWRQSSAAASIRRTLSYSNIGPLLRWLQRFHLMLFFFNGRYFEWCMRIVGVNLVRSNQAPKSGVRYTALGMILCLELAGTALIELISRRNDGRNINGLWRTHIRQPSVGNRGNTRILDDGANSRASREESGGGGGGGGGSRRRRSGDSDSGSGDRKGPEIWRNGPIAASAAVVSSKDFFHDDEEGNNSDSDRADESDQDNGENEKKNQCVLCMGRLKRTSATECGHLFCWECIIGWCQANPTGSAECPLCRQIIVPQGVLFLHWH